MSPLLAPLIAGLLVLAGSAALFFRYRFERFVGLRYLLRGRGSPVAMRGTFISGGVTALGLAALFGGRGHARTLETVGVTLVLLGGIALLLFLLLRVFSVFTTVSTMGVLLGVASLVVVLAVTSGFEREFQDKVLAVNAHLLVMSYGNPGLEERERGADEYMQKLRDLPGLASMAKFTMPAGEVMIGKVGANLKGIDLKAGGGELKRALVAGHIEDLARPAHCATGPRWAEKELAGASGEWVGRLMIGTELAHQLHLGVGDCVSVLIPFSGDELDAQPASFTFSVVGLFDLGFHEYDTRFGYTSLEDARKLGGARGTLFGVELRFHDPTRALQVEKEVVARIGYEPRLTDWATMNHNLFMALQMQKLIIVLFLMIIIIVAAFNIVASLTMIVLSKVREMAILSTMGARNPAVMRVFVVAGSLVGFVGVGLGLAYGLAVCALAQVCGYPLDPKVYLIAQLPVEISWPELLFVAAATQLVCLIATLYPAVRAGRLKVVEGLRYV